VSHAFDDIAVLSDVSIDLAPDEFVAVVGPSGCGKSTLLRVLAGLVGAHRGSVSVAGDDVTAEPGRVGYLPQGDSLLPWRRALANAAVGLEATGVAKGEARTLAEELFTAFGLHGFESSWPHELSGGMRQRVAVLRTFLLPHDVIALDEPFGALDALTRRSIQSWMRSVWSASPRTTVLITHDVEEALLLADRVLVMTPRPGRISLTVDVELDPHRPAGIETSEPFVTLKRRLLDALFGHEVSS
jgi:ABC-type nitrate/sulfonate/bicarbonate transport system ATPase subunit